MIVGEGMLRTLFAVALCFGFTASACSNSATPARTVATATPPTEAAIANTPGSPADKVQESQPAQAPEDFVRSFFREYLGTLSDKFWYNDRELLSSWFDGDLVNLLLDKMPCQEGAANCNPAFDPILDTALYEGGVLPTLQVTRVGAGQPPRVRVDFQVSGEARTMTYTLAKDGTGWKISDIESSNYGSLRGFLERR